MRTTPFGIVLRRTLRRFASIAFAFAAVAAHAVPIAYTFSGTASGRPMSFDQTDA